MIISIVYVILAALGLGIIICLHELGHYLMARKVGMKVEAFGIGFGKPLYTWKWHGVNWNLCWIPFGGYVKIAGMEKTDGIEPHKIPDGFFGKKPIDRIKVAVMGPVMNMLLGLFLFALVWMMGGREKSFSEFTRFIGFVEKGSYLSKEGIKPGDEITEVNGKEYHGMKDMLYAAMLDQGPLRVSGDKVDYPSLKENPFEVLLKRETDPFAPLRTFLPAECLIYHESSARLNAFSKDSPLHASGLQEGDQIVWADGSLIFSKQQLEKVTSPGKTFLTVLRDQTVFTVVVPRVKISDLQITEGVKAELNDWQHEAKLSGRVEQLFFIPYYVGGEGVVERPLTFIDENATTVSSLSLLQKGDQILAVDGTKVHSSYELIKALQTRQVHLIVKRGGASLLDWRAADAVFLKTMGSSSIESIARTIGGEELKEMNGFYLLNPITPKPLDQLPLTPHQKEVYQKRMEAEKESIESIKNPQQKQAALDHFQESQKSLKLGVVFRDQNVIYNPTPWTQFSNVFTETWRTLASLFVGNVSPKHLSGPVGIVQVMQHSFGVSLQEAFFWMAVVSINLGLLNLLPIPVLDGGHILFAGIEMVTRKPIQAKTMQKLIIPFVVLLIFFFVFVTYQDVLRLFRGLF